MTKTQMSTEAARLLNEHKANKALTTAMTELFEQYMATAKGTAEKREKVITVDNNEYVWCNRHEVYEPSTNFNKESDRKGGQKFQDSCRLATKHWSQLGKEVKVLQDKLDKALDEENYEVAGTTNKELKEAKEVRSGRYNHEANTLQYPDIEDYIYDYSLFIQDK